eukprot:g31331.t1
MLTLLELAMHMTNAFLELKNSERFLLALAAVLGPCLLNSVVILLFVNFLVHELGRWMNANWSHAQRLLAFSILRPVLWAFSTPDWLRFFALYAPSLRSTCGPWERRYWEEVLQARTTEVEQELLGSVPGSKVLITEEEEVLPDEEEQDGERPEVPLHREEALHGAAPEEGTEGDAVVPVDVGAGPVALDGHTDVAVDVVPGGAEEAPQAVIDAVQQIMRRPCDSGLSGASPRGDGESHQGRLRRKRKGESSRKQTASRDAMVIAEAQIQEEMLAAITAKVLPIAAAACTEVCTRHLAALHQQLEHLRVLQQQELDASPFSLNGGVTPMPLIEGEGTDKVLSVMKRVRSAVRRSRQSPDQLFKRFCKAGGTGVSGLIMTRSDFIRVLGTFEPHLEQEMVIRLWQHFLSQGNGEDGLNFTEFQRWFNLLNLAHTEHHYPSQEALGTLSRTGSSATSLSFSAVNGFDAQPHFAPYPELDRALTAPCSSASPLLGRRHSRPPLSPTATPAYFANMGQGSMTLPIPSRSGSQHSLEVYGGEMAPLRVSDDMPLIATLVRLGRGLASESLTVAGAFVLYDEHLEKMLSLDKFLEACEHHRIPISRSEAEALFARLGRSTPLGMRLTFQDLEAELGRKLESLEDRDAWAVDQKVEANLKILFLVCLC